MATGSVLDDFTYAVIANIPYCYHSRDLRNYFSQMTETGGFECFHFRHRPAAAVNSGKNHENIGDAVSESVSLSVSVSPSLVSEDTVTNNIGISDIRNVTKCSRSKLTFCCVAKLKTGRIDELVRIYHRKHWLDRKGDCLPSMCMVSKIKISDHTADPASHYQTKRERQNQHRGDRVTFTRNDLLQLKELRPPDIMPNGNVGTPTKTFLKLIDACKLPSGVIQKLGLTFPKCRGKRMYGDVPFNYGAEVDEIEEIEEQVVKTANGHELKSHDEYIEASSFNVRKDTESDRSKAENAKELDGDNSNKDSDEDDDGCEDWERHEALTDDADGKERNKERLFECEMEVVWEKGGSGLVFYTDAQYWDAKQGDFDERTTDDWDVDMSSYYEPNAGDKDARDMLSMRLETRRRQGQEDTCVRSGIGQFEKYTKGVGRRILQKQGWRDGAGLGSSEMGRADALEHLGQSAKDHRGLGYVGEKLARFGVGKKIRRTPTKDRPIVSTVYDDPDETDTAEPLLRRHEPYGLKYRPSHIQFLKANGS